MKRILLSLAAFAAFISNTAMASPVEVHSKGNVTVVEGHGFEAIAEEGALSWCYEGRDGATCGGIETKWGCQYFPEEGPADDIAVCILTTLAEACCECLSVCPDEGDEDQAFDPEALFSVLADNVSPTAGPGCGDKDPCVTCWTSGGVAMCAGNLAGYHCRAGYVAGQGIVAGCSKN